MAQLKAKLKNKYCIYKPGSTEKNWYQKDTNEKVLQFKKKTPKYKQMPHKIIHVKNNINFQH